jgi:hypothetical protein
VWRNNHCVDIWSRHIYPLEMLFAENQIIWIILVTTSYSVLPSLYTDVLAFHHELVHVGGLYKYTQLQHISISPARSSKFVVPS